MVPLKSLVLPLSEESLSTNCLRAIAQSRLGVLLKRTHPKYVPLLLKPLLLGTLLLPLNLQL